MVSQEEVEVSSNVKVIAHGSRVFAKIREVNGITYEHILASLSPELNRDSAFNSGEGSGKSGSFFVFSHDKRFLIKTINKEEFNTLMEMLPMYS